MCVEKISSRRRDILCVEKIRSRPRGILCVDKIGSVPQEWRQPRGRRFLSVKSTNERFYWEERGDYFRQSLFFPADFGGPAVCPALPHNCTLARLIIKYPAFQLLGKKPSDKGPREKTTKVAEGNPANLWQLVASCCSALAHTISSLYVPFFFLVRLFSSLCFIMFTFGAFSRI